MDRGRPLCVFKRHIGMRRKQDRLAGWLDGLSGRPLLPLVWGRRAPTAALIEQCTRSCRSVDILRLPCFCFWVVLKSNLSVVGIFVSSQWAGAIWQTW